MNFLKSIISQLNFQNDKHGKLTKIKKKNPSYNKNKTLEATSGYILLWPPQITPL